MTTTLVAEPRHSLGSSSPLPDAMAFESTTNAAQVNWSEVESGVPSAPEKIGRQVRQFFRPESRAELEMVIKTLTIDVGDAGDWGLDRVLEVAATVRVEDRILKLVDLLRCIRVDVHSFLARRAPTPIHALLGLDQDVRAALLTVLAKRDTPAGRELIRSALVSPPRITPTERDQLGIDAIFALSRMDDEPFAVTTLITALHGTRSPQLRKAIHKALADFADA